MELVKTKNWATGEGWPDHPERFQPPGSTYGTCCLCHAQGLMDRHHSKPAVGGVKKRGPIWIVCRDHHLWLHKYFSNLELQDLMVQEARNILLNGHYAYAHEMQIL